MATVSGLYVLIDPAACKRVGPVETTRLALEGGASLIQWRDKLRDKGAQLADARKVFGLCRAFDATFIVNDHADLALVLAGDDPDADMGIHLGQSDLPVAAARRILPAAFVVGASTNNVAEAIAAAEAGATYIAVGDLFGTASKQGTRAASPSRLKEVKDALGQLPVVGIGGINLGNVGEVIRAGADAVAVISAVCGADDPRAAAAQLVGAIEAAKVNR